VELTPEERQRIFEEETIRLEARAQAERAKNEQLLAARRASRGTPNTKKIILYCSLALVLFIVVVWRVRLTLANDELIAMLQQAEPHVGTTPSDDDWKDAYANAAVIGARDGNHRSAALLFIQSMQYAVTGERLASSYRSLGLELEALGLIVTAEHCHRLAVGLAPGDDFGRRCLADVLVERKKYAEAEPIYHELLQHTSDVGDRASLNYRLSGLLKATGRKTEADNYMKEFEKESEKWLREAK